MTDDTELPHLYDDDLVDAENAGIASSESEPDPVREDRPEPSARVKYTTVQLRRARELLTRLYAARRAARFYPMDHPSVVESVAALFAALRAYHGEGTDVQFSFFEGEILLGEQVLTEESVQFDQLVRDMAAIGVGSLTVYRGATSDELAKVVEILAMDSVELDHLGGVVAAMGSKDVQGIEMGPALVVERAAPVTGDLLEQAKASYGSAVSLIREMDRLVKANRLVPAAKVKGAVRSLVDNVVGNRYAMLQLTGLKNYDEYTFYHSANVAILSLAIGSLITNDYRFLSSLGTGALLHDLGKLSVDLDILNKPGSLSVEEWSTVREHPTRGAQMVSILPGVDRAAIVTILEHHMRYDSGGYPQRTPLRRQHLASRIVAVADSFDAMTSRRSYSAARMQDAAMSQLLESAGTALDPVLVKMFVRLMGVYPPRSVVRLKTGEVAVVLRPSERDVVRPTIRVITSPSGDLIEPSDIDLMTAPELAIDQCVDPEALNIDVDAFLE